MINIAHFRYRSVALRWTRRVRTDMYTMRTFVGDTGMHVTARTISMWICACCIYICVYKHWCNGRGGDKPCDIANVYNSLFELAKFCPTSLTIKMVIQYSNVVHVHIMYMYHILLYIFKYVTCYIIFRTYQDNFVIVIANSNCIYYHYRANLLLQNIYAITGK